MRVVPSLLCSVGLASLIACGGGESSGIPDSCNPLGGTTCLMPWPSSAYLVPSADTATGYKVDLPVEAMPVNIDNKPVDPTGMNRADGFGPSGVILAAFPNGVSGDGLPPNTDPTASLAADSPVILFDVATGDRVSFFAEVDMNTDKPEERALIIHPLERMKPATRYAVAIRNTVKGGDGMPLERPEAFQAVLDGKTFNHPLFDRVAGHYDDIFADLDAMGVSKDDLVLAWDFVTASDDYLTRDLLSMREQALPAIGDAGANLTFEASEESSDPNLVEKFLVGTYTAPNFLTDGEADDSILRRDANDLPEMDGMYTANFAAIIPKCVETAQLPLKVMVFGHGLFGDGKDSLDSGLLRKVANDYCFVTVAGDFIGLTGRQVTAAALAANNGSRANTLTEKLAQSVINFIALENLVRGPMAQSDMFKYQNQPIIDPSQVYYFGASLGGIMGNVFMAYDPTITRGALGVPGGAWSLLIERSFAWSPLQVAVKGAYEDEYVYDLMVAFLGLSFEPYDPITTAGRVINDPLPDTPAKQILMYEGLGDCLVTNLSTEMVARTMGLDVTGPTIREPYGVPVNEQPMSSAFTIYNEHRTPLPPTTNVPPQDDNGTHSGVNARDANLNQIQQFFEEGTIVNKCQIGGTVAPCDCDTGACGERR